MSDTSRKEAIENLETLKAFLDVNGVFVVSDAMKKSIDIAIASLETDEAYQLEYERTTKNDLGVDCISRVQAQTEIEMNASRYTIAKERGGMGQVEWSDQLIEVSDAVDIIRKLPTVTPQEPRKGHWIETAEEFYKAINEKGGGVNENTDFFTDDIACSECLAKFNVIDNEADRFDFCPCCGSDNR